MSDLIEWLLVAAYNERVSKNRIAQHEWWTCECASCVYIAWASRTLPAFWSFAWPTPRGRTAMSDDVALGSPSRVNCPTCGMVRGRPCKLGERPTTWLYCEARVEALTELLARDAVIDVALRIRARCYNIRTTLGRDDRELFDELAVAVDELRFGR